MRVAVAILLLLFFTDSVSAYGARASGSRDTRHGAGWITTNAASPEEANRMALQGCNAMGFTDCRIVYRFSNTCLASYVDMLSGSEWYFTAESLPEAQRFASNRCQSGARTAGPPNCQPNLSVCDRVQAATNLVPSAVPRTVTPNTETITLGEYSMRLLAQAIPEPLKPYPLHLVGGVGAMLALLYLALRKNKAPAQTAPSQLFAQPVHQNIPTVAAPANGARFQVSIKHTQERNGFFVQLSLRFSQDTINLIKARRLEDHIVISGDIKPPPTRLGGMAFDEAGRIVGVASKLALLFFIPAGIYKSELGFLLLIGGVLGLIWFYFGSKKFVESYDEQFIRIKYFFRNPTIRLYSKTALGAKVLDQEIRESLQSLRFVLDESVFLPDADIFDV